MPFISDGYDVDNLNEVGKEHAEKSDIPLEKLKSPNPLHLMKWYLSAINWATGEIDTIEKKANINCTCSCGCSACCKQAIVVTSTEMLIIKKYIDGLSDDVKNTIYQNSCNVSEILNQKGLAVGLHHMDSTKIQELYFSLGLDCPVLGANLECLLYPVRPGLCWAYRSYGNPDKCKTAYDVNSGYKYDYYENIILDIMFEARKPDRQGFRFLADGIKQSFENEI